MQCVIVVDQIGFENILLKHLASKMYSSENSIETKVSLLALHQKVWNDTQPKVSELKPSPAKICKNTEFKSQRRCCLVMLKTL